jgi:DNA-binding NarL/FixJ family response regulator
MEAFRGAILLMRFALKSEIIRSPILGDLVMTDRIAQKNSKPEVDTESRLASCEATIQQLREKVEAAARAVASLEPGRKKMEEHMSKLTPTQKKVYPLLTHGKTDKEIAAKLGIVPRTASMHVKHIKTKLEITDRADFILPLPFL